MNKLTKDATDQLEVTSKMLAWLKENFSEVGELDMTDKLAIMARAQWVQDQLKTFELRMREEIINDYDCELGKTKSKTDRDIGFKVETGRPLNMKFYSHVSDNELKKALGVTTKKALDELFPAKRAFSKSAYNQLSEEQQKGLSDCMDVGPGQISVKVTEL